MAITGAVAAAVRKFDPFPEFSEVRAFRGRRETGGRQFYKSGGLIVPRYEMLPGVLVQGGADFGQREVNGAWRGARDGEPLIGDGGLRGAEARAQLNPGPGAPASWAGSKTSNGVQITKVGTGVEFGLPFADYRFHGTPTANFADIDLCFGSPRWAATPNQTYTVSAAAKLVDGSPNNVASIGYGVVEEAAGLAYIGMSTATLAAILSSPDDYVENRAVRTFGATAASGRGAAVMNLTVGQAIDVTIRFYRPNITSGPDINDPPILQTSALAATRTTMGYRETGRSIAPVHYGVARARWLAPVANHAGAFPILFDMTPAVGLVGRLVWYANKSDAVVRLAVTADSTASSTRQLGAPVLMTYTTIAWARRADALAVSIDGAAVLSGAADPGTNAYSRLGFTGAADVAAANLGNVEMDFFATADGEITNDNLQALAARFAA